MINEFQSELAWHDATLRAIIIDRENQDVVLLKVQWPPYEGSGYVCIEFFGCYGLKTDLHFGHSGPDNILTASCDQHCLELEKLKNAWKKMGINLDDLYCFTIETNSTGGIIKIFVKGFRIKKQRFLNFRRFIKSFWSDEE